MNRPSIVIADLHKAYGAQEALRGVSFEVRPGEITCLLGPNGAGKSTLLHTIMGLSLPTSGTVTLDGVDLRDPGIHDARRRVGFLPEEVHLYDHLTPREFLGFLSRLHGHGRGVPGRVTAAIEAMGLQGEADRLCRTLSLGTRRRAALAAAFLPDPDILILDEPTNALDAVSARAVKERLRVHRNLGRTVLFSTHMLEMAERLADRFVILVDGTVRFEGTLTALRAWAGPRSDASLEGLFLHATAAAPGDPGRPGRGSDG